MPTFSLKQAATFDLSFSRLAPKGSRISMSPMLKWATLKQKKTCLQTGSKKMILVYIANFTPQDNCEEGEFLYNSPV